MWKDLDVPGCAQVSGQAQKSAVCACSSMSSTNLTCAPEFLCTQGQLMPRERGDFLSASGTEMA